MWPCFKGTQPCPWLTEARNENLSLTHRGGVKAPTGLLWPLQKVNSQENEPHLLLQDLSSGFGLFIPKSTGARGGLRTNCDSKSFGRSFLLHFIGSCHWWKQSWRVLLGHHGHMKDTDGPKRSSQDSSAVPETAVTDPKGPGTALSECMQSKHKRCLRWEARALLWRPNVLFLTLWSLLLGS